MCACAVAPLEATPPTVTLVCVVPVDPVVPVVPVPPPEPPTPTRVLSALVNRIWVTPLPMVTEPVPPAGLAEARRLARLAAIAATAYPGVGVSVIVWVELNGNVPGTSAHSPAGTLIVPGTPATVNDHIDPSATPLSAILQAVPRAV